MADIQAPTAIIDTQQSITSYDFQARKLAEERLLKQYEQTMNSLDPARGYEVR